MYDTLKKPIYAKKNCLLGYMGPTQYIVWTKNNFEQLAVLGPGFWVVASTHFAVI